MNANDIPWLESAILCPLLGSAWAPWLKNPASARRWAVTFTSFTLALSLGAWWQFASAEWPAAGLLERWSGYRLLALDALSGPLLVLAALLYLLTTMATVGAKVQRLAFGRTLFCEAVLLAIFASHTPWPTIALVALDAVMPLVELRSRKQPARVFAIHMGLFTLLLCAGQALMDVTYVPMANVGGVLMLTAVLIRTGMAPFHCWMPDLFERAGFGSVLLFVAPLVGVYVAMRLVLPVTGPGFDQVLGWVSLATAVYAAGMALVQKEARRFFCFIFLSHSALVLVGLATMTPLGVTGALCVWLSLGLSMTGFALTLRALEARHRRLPLTRFHGLYEQTPALALCFLLTGLASIGFPGTFGFWSNDLLAEGVLESFPFAGIGAVFAAALNGIAIVRVYFLLFTGSRHRSTVPLRLGRRERVAVWAVAALLLAGGMIPQPIVHSRWQAAQRLLAAKKDALDR